MKNLFRKHDIVIKNIFFTILPSVGFVLIEAVPIFDDLCKALLVIIFSVFIINTIIKISLREEEHDREIEDELKKYEKYVISQKLLNSIMEIEKRKNDLLKNDILPDYKTEVLLYNPHEYVEDICSNLKSLISNLTEIDLSSLSVSFIYCYPNDNSNWQWITRKNSTINQELHDFVTNEKTHSYFNYIITNNLSSHFEHDKEKLVREGHYWISENDKRYPTRLGSIASYKMSFIKNEVTLCVGYLVISTYGRTFVEDLNNIEEIQKFNILMSNTIIPSYRHVIEKELGFMYERHYYRSADGL